LGFDATPHEAARTQDVDAIISVVQEKLAELRDAFAQAKPIVVELARGG